MYARESPDDVLPHVLQVLYDWLCNKERKLHPDGGSELLRRLEGTAFDCRVDHPNLVHEECRTSRALLDGMSCPNVYDGRYDLDDEWAIPRSVPTTLWDLYFGRAPPDRGLQMGIAYDNNDSTKRGGLKC